MPQLDPTFFVSQIFWLTLAFGLLYFAFDKILVPKMNLIFEIRRSSLEQNIKNAEVTKEEVIKIEKEYLATLTHARKSATIMIADTSNDIKKKAEKKKAEFAVNLDKELANSEERVKVFVEESKKEIIKITTAAVKLALKEFAHISISDKEIESELTKNGL